MNRRFLTRTLILTSATALLMIPAAANAVVIHDISVEQGFGWTGTGGYWQSNALGFLTPDVNEGVEHIAVDTYLGNSASISLGGVLEQGTYTVEFALGDFSNFAFPTISIDFAGLTLGDASFASTPTPVPGFWELWSITWIVDGSDPNLGNALDFTLVPGGGPDERNVAFDGVGSLSASGSGFVVDYAAPIPEPSTASLFGLGLGALAWRNRAAQGQSTLR